MIVICVSNKNRPNEIPNSVWSLLIEGNPYTVIEKVKCNIQGGQIGYKLAEINLDAYAPYTCFSANRFRIPVPEEILEEEVGELAV